MHNAKIEHLHVEYGELVEFCRSNGQSSFELYIGDTYKKVLLIAAASYFETVITEAILEFVRGKTRNNPEIVEFVKKKAVSRQYHTFFDWNGKNANQFFKLFGDGFTERVQEEIQTKNLYDAELAFLSIGRSRNQLVHQNYIEVLINDTFEDIYNKYEKACEFVELITQILCVCVISIPKFMAKQRQQKQIVKLSG